LAIYSYPTPEKDFALEVAKGNIPGHSIVFLSGKHPSVAVGGTPTTIWNNTANTYPWSVWDAGAAALYLVSTSAADTQTILLTGLDASYNIITATVTLTGTTPVNTGATTFKRLNSAIIIAGVAAVGTISIRYGSSVGSIVGLINPNTTNTSMSIYTVPAGYTAFSTYGDFSVNKGNQAELAVKWRFFGLPFITVYQTEVYEQFISSAPSIPGAIPEKTDLDNMVEAVDNAGSRVYSNQQLLLIDNRYL
jgi:hypothetical protein